jgi:trehalose-phosphatase
MVIGIISGRTLTDLKSKVCFPRLVYAGTCGLELELPHRLIQHPEAAKYAPVILVAADVINAIIEDFPGAWVEQKRLALTVHYRQLRLDDVVFFKQTLAAKLSRFAGVLISVDGSKATEILPDIGWGKGEALHTIIAHDGREAIPIYAGNDANDVSAMQAALARGGSAIGVGPDAPACARHRLPDTECLTEHLHKLLALLRAV